MSILFLNVNKVKDKVVRLLNLLQRYEDIPCA